MRPLPSASARTDQDSWAYATEWLEAADERRRAAEARPTTIYASWGRRALALVVDSLVFLGVFLVPASFLTAVPRAVLQNWFGILMLVFAIYYTVLIGARGQTLGKMALGFGLSMVVRRPRTSDMGARSSAG